MGARQEAVGSLLALEEEQGRTRLPAEAEAEAAHSAPQGGQVLSAWPLGATAQPSLGLAVIVPHRVLLASSSRRPHPRGLAEAPLLLGSRERLA